MTTVDLNDVQAALFLELTRCGAWDVTEGSVEIHFAGGQPRKVQVIRFATLQKLSTEYPNTRWTNKGVV